MRLLCDLRSSGMLRSADLCLVTDVSGRPIGPSINGQAVSLLRNVPEERISNLHRSESMKSHRY